MKKKKSGNKTPRQIIIEYLKSVGADGIVNSPNCCGCSIDELNICESINIDDCIPAKLIKCCDCKEKDVCGDINNEGSYFPI